VQSVRDRGALMRAIEWAMLVVVVVVLLGALIVATLAVAKMVQGVASHIHDDQSRSARPLPDY
jgi:hypothetical protein